MFRGEKETIACILTCGSIPPPHTVDAGTHLTPDLVGGQEQRMFRKVADPRQAEHEVVQLGQSLRTAREVQAAHVAFF